MSNAAPNFATYGGSGDFVSPEHAAANPHYGPIAASIEINGARYDGAHTRRALRTAMTKAGARVCTVNGVEWNAAGLAYLHCLA